MNEARNYSGRVRETYRITAKSDQSIESIVSAASSSSSDSDTSSASMPQYAQPAPPQYGFKCMVVHLLLR